MRVYETSEIRNVAVVGHGASGKTSLVSALLFSSGAVNRLGKVDQGTTISDYDEEAIERKKTVTASVCHLEWNKNKINLIDTPGYGAFMHEARSSLRVVEGALVVIDSSHGAEVNTEKVWGYAEEFAVARILVVSRMDRERASFSRALESVRKSLSRSCIAVQIPIGEEKEFKGVVDLVHMKAYLFHADESGKFTEGPIPADLADAAKAARESLMEAVAEGDDILMEHYFEKGELPEGELESGLKKGVADGRLFPVLAASGLHNLGAQPILDAILSWIPSPAAMAELKGTNPADGAEIARKPAASESPSAFVFKTLIDPFAGKISYFRAYSGTIKGESHLLNVARAEMEKLTTVDTAQGKTLAPIAEIRAGDIGAVTKLKFTATGDTLADKAHPIRYEPVHFPEPAISWAIEPKTRADEDKISAALHKLLDADPMLRTSRDAQTHEMLISGAGQEHVEVMMSRLKRQGVEAKLKVPKIPYRETITRAVKYVEYTHKKQTGGAGQFAKVAIDVEPLPRGAGYEFVDRIVGGVIDQSFRPSVDKGVQSRMVGGVVAGYPVVDVRVSLVDGKTHPVDSKDIAFQVAGREAFKKAVHDARPTLLEPTMSVEISVPEETMGDIVGDLNSRRGRVIGMDQKGHTQVIRATCPLAEMLSYSATLNSITSGRGSFHMEIASYDEVPAHLQEKIIAEAKAARGVEKEEEA
ncbi:MAG TPA: elongation factor G [Verrucomicrobiae bacterium]|nr:elongation factor G [Verrucomicrobiae bacterium]